jgi:hypothetical protein
MEKFSNKDLQSLTGLSARQTIYLAEKGIVVPEFGDAAGRGSARSYSRRNLAQLLLVQALRKAGFDFPAMRVVAALVFGFFDELDKIVIPGSSASAPTVLNLADGKYGYLSSKDGRATSKAFEIASDGTVKPATTKPEKVKAEAVVLTQVDLGAALSRLRSLQKSEVEGS